MALGGRKKPRPKAAAPSREPAPETAPPPPPSRRRRFPRITEAGVALVALLVSGTAFLVNGWMYVRGSELVVLKPDHYILYRDSGPYGADMFLALPLQIVNAAGADFGDVVVRAEAQVFSGRRAPGVFPYSALSEPVLARDVDAAVANCPQGARCIANTGFYVIERTAKLLDVPGGGSRSEYLAFQLNPENCLGSRQYCDGFRHFDGALAALRREEAPVIRVVVRFQFDGDHVVECAMTSDEKLRGQIFDYLAEKGWAQQPCIRATMRKPMGLPPPGLGH